MNVFRMALALPGDLNSSRTERALLDDHMGLRALRGLPKRRKAANGHFYTGCWHTWSGERSRLPSRVCSTSALSWYTSPWWPIPWVKYPIGLWTQEPFLLAKSAKTVTIFDLLNKFASVRPVSELKKKKLIIINI